MNPVYSLIRVKAGSLKDVVGQLEALMGVVEVTVVTGKYDIVVKVQSDMIVDALQVVIESIHHLDGVIDTETLVGVPMEKEKEAKKRKKSLLYNM